ADSPAGTLDGAGSMSACAGVLEPRCHAIGGDDLGRSAGAIVAVEDLSQVHRRHYRPYVVAPAIPLAVRDVPIRGLVAGALGQRPVDPGEHAAPVDGAVAIARAAAEGGAGRAGPALVVDRAEAFLGDARDLPGLVALEAGETLPARHDAGHGNQCGLHRHL